MTAAPDRRPSPQPADINPYAAPTVPDGLRSPAIVGAWRDGKLLVVHPQAPLPPVCLKTGQPPHRVCTCDISWSHPIDWSQRQLELRIPLSKSWWYWYVLWRPLIAALSALWFVGLLASAARWNDVGCPLALVAFAGGLAGYFCYRRLNRIIYFVRTQDDLFWLAGAHRDFLAKLPEWSAIQAG